MVKPFLNHKEIFAAQPSRYTYDKKDTLLNRYFALFGVNDPVPYYLNKRDRLSWVEEKWNLLGESQDCGEYFLVKFTPDKLPTIGANGYIVKKDIIKKVTREPLNFFHIDSNLDLVRMGYNAFAAVKTSIFHKTGETFLNYFRRRMRYMNIYLNDKKKRRYHVYDPRTDKFKLVKFVFFSITFVKPFLDAFRGFIKIRDIAWFLHPFICLGTVSLYGSILIKKWFYLVFNRS